MHERTTQEDSELYLLTSRILSWASHHYTHLLFQRIYQARLNDKDSNPYKVLGIKSTDSDETIRKAWIKLTKEHHPDYLVAKGMPSEFIEQATNEMSSINIAYDKIQKIRGFNW